MLEKEYDYFVSVRDRLVKEHRGEYVIIKDNETIGFYPSENAAITAMTGNELVHCIINSTSIHGNL